MPLTTEWHIADNEQVGLTSYFDHAVKGISIRKIAIAQGVHPSTVLRRVRKIELRRDDPLIDEAIDQISRKMPLALDQAGDDSMSASETETTSPEKTRFLIGHLKQLNQKGALLVVASDLENAAIMKKHEDGDIRNIMSLGRTETMVLALNDWVELTQKGRMSRYNITNAGRKALKRLAAELSQPEGMAEAPNAFAHQHIEWGTRVIHGDNFGETTSHRVNHAESPITLLARRKNKDGSAFLKSELVSAGERLREDFELAQMGPQTTQNWAKFLTGPTQSSNFEPGNGSSTALKRFRNAMSALGPDLSDIALYCCCLHQGLEVAEKRLGWSARSGKVVLKIALQRLHNYYDELHGAHGPMIG